jgi:hypothetical protein
MTDVPFAAISGDAFARSAQSSDVADACYALVRSTGGIGQ